jgi:AcrR family transcriptional regulator
MSQPAARDRILATAARLFMRDGYRATGIDKIIAESGVAKMSLYRHFKSKNDLIAAFLEELNEEWMRDFVDKVELHFAQHAQLSALADALGDCFSQQDFRGCAFINVVAETGTAGDMGHIAQAVLHKRRLESYIAALAERLGLGQPASVAADAMLCVEGMMVRFQMTRDPAIVQFGQRVLRLIEDAAMAGSKAASSSAVKRARKV